MLCSLAGPQSRSLHYPHPWSCRPEFFRRTTRLQHQKATEANAFFGRGRGGDKGQRDREDIVSPSWGEESPDWTDAPDQLDLLEEIWYEVRSQQIFPDKATKVLAGGDTAGL
jgi:hypothetical protein